MGILRSMILEELDRSRRMRKAYAFELSGMPQEAIVRKRIKGRDYYYWMARKDGKVVNRYISPKCNDLNALLKQDQRRRHLKLLLLNLKKEIVEMERYLKGPS
jgi:hypothetical protein